MLQIPQRKFSRSVKKINIDVDALGDWIEATVLFSEETLSKSDVVDFLIEEQICDDDDQDLAHEIADVGWSEVERRKAWSSAPTTPEINKRNIKESLLWSDDPVRAFFVMLSILRLYPDWAKDHANYSRQGELFERVIEEICPTIFRDWEIYRAGWSPSNTVSIMSIVADLCSRINTAGHPRLEEDWVSSADKDGGLDIVCYKKFPDNREATPVFFIQCASGVDWRNKVQTPGAGEWQKYLDAAVQPSTGIAAPFVIETKDIKRAGLKGQIIVFDRLRLLHAANSNSLALSPSLKTDVCDWINELLPSLPVV